MTFIKRTVLMLACAVTFTATSVFAADYRLSGEYNAWKQVSEYISGEFIDDTLTAEKIMEMGVSKLLELKTAELAGKLGVT